MDKEKLIKQLIAFGMYNYPIDRVADVLNMSYEELQLMIASDIELSEAYNNALDSVKRLTIENLIESTKDKVVKLKKPIKIRDGRNEKIVLAEEEVLTRGDVGAMKFLLVNLDSEKFTIDGKHNTAAPAPITINITPKDAPDVNVTEHNDGE